ncbi:3-oxoacyl-[acyl-carrier protein] reductase [Pseudomonas chlororaphis]|uniref:2,3-dihydroxy-2,3-dihydro-p-cumate dehydrogenase n=1 Tax=Pseudomonas chlororaphis subsp. aurantiaca TaxID=86192 RepID=A0AAJ1E1S3_9PSED|nr:MULTISPECIES: SDR family NAD(P)-dependent oxidoreductase [Pseudomonas]AZD67426.1 3-oxoacyl-ACP reductase [Pseudomonas chlororaphis subsp. aurantiaca]MBP5077244.1 SDR family oxidoreductase [Pseudomonas chlororaphis]MBU4632692.1 SDR family oxidoreductase [Pseudomonas chlororaphis subsp. aurantiaca]PWY37800.1 SDR family NAD(P)-dependent oxidoreductase [Pseudomonas sp. RW409]QIT23402.1 SDR family oxidoreductase [Pseudomonas chlororaphis subsp. aurantiaca]
MNHIALVTGAAQGLGYTLCARLLEAGYKVVVTDRSLEAATAAAGQLDDTGESTVAIKLDVTCKADFAAALAQVLEQWGALHVLVNNAAITMTTPVMQISPEEFDAVVGLNLRSVFVGCQVIGAYMAEAGYGRIINMASLAGQNGGTATGAHYAASKGGIITLTKIFAKEFAGQGVTVNAIAPGPIDSPAVRAAVPVERMESLIGNIPVRRLGDAGFLGDLVVQLARPEAYFTTGATWDVNGGLFMR